jgi:hypothetical protein
MGDATSSDIASALSSRDFAAEQGLLGLAISLELQVSA